MTPELAIHYASMGALVILGVALIVAVVRILIGPTLADRILALDLLSITAMGFIGAVAIRTGLSLYLDIGLALALLGFLATLALVRYMLSQQTGVKHDPE